ncbi:ATP-binding cassette domain-containing protein [Humibacter antri]
MTTDTKERTAPHIPGLGGPTATSAAIEANALRKSFGREPAVADVTFRVEPGRIVGLLGPNGAGKTTTMRMLLGLVQPDAGSSTIAGVPFQQLPSPSRTVGAMLDASGLHPSRTGRQHLRIASALAGVSADRVEAVLHETGMAQAADRRISGYSLGMRQRLALASALVGEPGVLVLDEPANGLDPGGVHWLREWLRKFADRGGTALVSSHGLAEVAKVCDDVIVIAHGRVLASGTLQHLTSRHDGSLESFYLDITRSAEEVR